MCHSIPPTIIWSYNEIQMVSSILIEAATRNLTWTENLLNNDRGIQITAVPINVHPHMCKHIVFYPLVVQICLHEQEHEKAKKKTMHKPCHGYSDRGEIGYVWASCSDGHDPRQYPIAESSNVIPEWETILAGLALVPNAGVWLAAIAWLTFTYVFQIEKSPTPQVFFSAAKALGSSNLPGSIPTWTNPILPGAHQD